MADPREMAGEHLAALAGRTMTDLHLRSGGERLDGPVIGHVARQLWLASRNGSICLHLVEMDLADIETVLGRSPLVQTLADGALAAGFQPMVLQQDRLYMLRHWQAEQSIAIGLLALARRKPEPEPSRGLPAPTLESESADSMQSEAIRVALKRALLVLSGGPGTGKTTTLGAIVCAVRGQSPNSRIALAAPTGKAAARLAQAIHAAGGNRGLASTGTLISATLHRLLGYRSDGSFTYGAENPLPFDLVIVDECSMVDAMLGARLIESIKPSARLILAGDRDQLSSVEPGAFFGAVCAANFAPVVDCIVVLQTNYRQSESPEIVAWADAIRGEQLNDQLPVDGKQVFVHGRGETMVLDNIIDQAVAGYLPLVKRSDGIAIDSVLALLRDFQSLRVLAVLRSGPHGVAALNQRIVKCLRELTGAVAGEWFAGRLVIVTRNMPALELYNGDIGLAVRDANGTLQVIFDQHGLPQRLLPLQMPPHADAFAMTVHQSQGSDFDEVILLPAAAQHPLATRAALYTAVTRARSRLHIHANSDDLRWASRTGDRSDGALTERMRLIALASSSQD